MWWDKQHLLLCAHVGILGRLLHDADAVARGGVALHGLGQLAHHQTDI